MSFLREEASGVRPTQRIGEDGIAFVAGKLWVAMHALLGCLALTAIVLIALALLAAAIASMRRGPHRGSSSLGSAMQEIESLFVESKKHVVHEMRAEEKEEDAGAGDPPVK